MCRARPGCPGTLSRTTDASLNCAFVENTLVFVVSKIGPPGIYNTYYVNDPDLKRWHISVDKKQKPIQITNFDPHEYFSIYIKIQVQTVRSFCRKIRHFH